MGTLWDAQERSARRPRGSSGQGLAAFAWAVMGGDGNGLQNVSRGAPHDESRSERPLEGCTMTSARDVDAGATDLEAIVAGGDLAARWYLRSRARGETVSEEHARRVAELGAELEARDAREARDRGT